MAGMSDTFEPAAGTGTVWVESMGGPLVVVPVSALDRWDGCTPGGEILGATGRQDDYDRACAVEDHAGVVDLRGDDSASALVLGDEPAGTCYLPDRTAFVRWLAADSEAELFAAAHAVLDDPATPWEDCGTWTTDGPAVLMDSADAGRDLGKPYPHGHGEPSAAPVPLPPGSWRVRAFHTWSDESVWVGVVHLLAQGENPMS
ncbi:hypothetical protein Kpho02_33630 [Kitasatospora phosalacinea]|uniref:Immunity protein 21 of polymorphic toxin system n=2 Tax=Kitasatospora phosalacinea TaxID=2065 RepID=A0A9W6Q9K8_9ACTN|nr:hypothetical protein Kpho02_33630 [Kitasatospora phosalacinea]